ncbi:MAG TPA: hypothetical protein VD862_03940 [Candidatus Paceibacterota bacterium]|nr:hypothetical protein [Candidatus Paceibacterota bacterium]
MERNTKRAFGIAFALLSASGTALFIYWMSAVVPGISRTGTFTAGQWLAFGGIVFCAVTTAFVIAVSGWSAFHFLRSAQTGAPLPKFFGVQ